MSRNADRGQEESAEIRVRRHQKAAARAGEQGDDVVGDVGADLQQHDDGDGA